jgi:hypothetical protein
VIYFLQSTDGGPVKIGHSEDVEARVRQLEGHYGRPMALLATMPGGRDEERAVHDRFAHLRLGRTEQFRPDRELFEFINRPLLVGPNPDAIEAMEAERKQLISIRGTEQWRDWLIEYAAFRRVPVTSLIDQVLNEAAKRDGFKLPPER